MHLKRTGKIWEKYFGWAVFDERAYFNIFSYILGNPIRHGIVQSFDELYEYKYCNYKKYVDEFSKEALQEQILTILKIKDAQDEESFFKNI